MTRNAGFTLEECRRDQDTGEVEGSVVWKERKEDVCGKKDGNGEMGKIGIFGVCGKK